MRRRALVLAVGIAGAIVIAVAIAAYSVPPPVSEVPTPTITPSPSPEATPSPTPSPSPSPAPTVAPTAVRTQEPLPTDNHAGLQLLSYWSIARQQIAALPPVPLIELDEPRDSDGDAWYRGLNPAGIPMFAVRVDYVMTPSTAFHEIGHAYQDIAQRKQGSADVMAKFWTFRGFPATWQDALRDAMAQPPGMAQWVRLPGEEWAESFSVAMIGAGHEKTLDYGRTINPVTMKAFFLSLTQ